SPVRRCIARGLQAGARQPLPQGGRERIGPRGGPARPGAGPGHQAWRPAALNAYLITTRRLPGAVTDAVVPPDADAKAAARASRRAPMCDPSVAAPHSGLPDAGR